MAATITLNYIVDLNNQPIAGLQNLHWSWWDTPDAATISGPPVNTGASGSTDVSGVMNLSLPGSALSTGQPGMLAVHTSGFASGWAGSALFKVPVN